MHTLKLYGPPGCGKTYAATAWMDQQIAEGADPFRVAFVSFTNAACDVARNRVAAALNLEPGELRYCATLHALCKRGLYVEGKDWNAEGRLRNFTEEYDYDLIPSRKADDDLDEMTLASGRDAPLLAIWHFGRNRLVRDAAGAWSAFEDYDPQGAAGMDYPRYLQLVTDYEEWKHGNALRDFTDLLEQAVEQGVRVPASVGVLDEAQDQTPLLWAVWDTLFRDCSATAIAADPDQSIYSFQGAAPELFNSRPSAQTVLLKQSRRLPRRIAERALRIIRQNSNRVDVPFEPVTPAILNERGRAWGDADLHGECSEARSLSDLNLTSGESWYLLVRNWRFVGQLLTDLEAFGIPYRVIAERYYSPWSDRGPLRAARACLGLAAGQDIGASAVLEIVKKTRVETKDRPGAWRYGSKTKIEAACAADPTGGFGMRDLYQLGLTEWGVRALLAQDFSVLDGISGRDQDAYKAARKRGTFGREPQVAVSTIHGVKGGEADNVALLTSCTPAPARNLEDRERVEEERRLGFVAVSRAVRRFYELDLGYGLPWNVV